MSILGKRTPAYRRLLNLSTYADNSTNNKEIRQLNRLIMPLMTRDKTGSRRDKKGTSKDRRDTTGTVGTS